MHTFGFLETEGKLHIKENRKLLHTVPAEIIIRFRRSLHIVFVIPVFIYFSCRTLNKCLQFPISTVAWYMASYCPFTGKLIGQHKQWYSDIVTLKSIISHRITIVIMFETNFDKLILISFYWSVFVCKLKLLRRNLCRFWWLLWTKADNSRKKVNFFCAEQPDWRSASFSRPRHYK